MSLLLLFLILLLATLFFYFKRPRAGASFLALSLFMILLIGQGWLPVPVLRHLQNQPPLTSPQWKEKNVIIVLGLGTVLWPDSALVSTHPIGVSRVREAARLYTHCKSHSKSCTILASGGDPAGNKISEAEVIKRELGEIGIPLADVLAERESRNTFQNARFSNKILQQHGFDHTVLVTSGTHLKRALLYFAHFGISADGAPSDRFAAVAAPFPIALNFILLDSAIHEHLGMLRYHLYNWLGWNPPKEASRESGGS